MNTKPVILSKNDILPFGKYKGIKLINILNDMHFTYLFWFIKTITTHKFDEEFMDLLNYNYSFFRKNSIHMGSYGNEFASENGIMEYF